jgi:hypothetical protein
MNKSALPTVNPPRVSTAALTDAIAEPEIGGRSRLVDHRSPWTIAWRRSLAFDFVASSPARHRGGIIEALHPHCVDLDVHCDGRFICQPMAYEGCVDNNLASRTHRRVEDDKDAGQGDSLPIALCGDHRANTERIAPIARGTKSRTGIAANRIGALSPD